ncbi:hypothetical protein MTR67_048026 [Solanum verrucosum]|uniref:Uncharacterized protein n=1 Tax=Solanum verrucosum TaxID=315347 RepID=A0AAF0V0U4_SOLVR|nr:hypothetical protein MTR67_048026 [Solanum verrucosum]
MYRTCKKLKFNELKKIFTDVKLKKLIFKRVGNILKTSIVSFLPIEFLLTHAPEAILSENASKVAKFSNYKHVAFETNRDPEILVLDSKVLGHLDRSGGAMTGDEVEHQVAIRDPTLAVWEKVVEALRACLCGMETCETRWRVQWYYRMFEATQDGLGKNANVHCIYVFLLAVEEL